MISADMPGASGALSAADTQAALMPAPGIRPPRIIVMPPMFISTGGVAEHSCPSQEIEPPVSEASRRDM